LPVVSYGCEGVLRAKFWGEYLDAENYIMMSFVICIIHLILLKLLHQGGRDLEDM